MSLHGSSIPKTRFPDLPGNVPLARETYWHTPYERRMQPTSNIDKVTTKGVLIEVEQPAPAEIRVSTKQGEFAFKPDLTPGDAPRLVSGWPGLGDCRGGRLAAHQRRRGRRLPFDGGGQGRHAVGCLRFLHRRRGRPGLRAAQSNGVWSAAEALAQKDGDYLSDGDGAGCEGARVGDLVGAGRRELRSLRARL